MTYPLYFYSAPSWRGKKKPLAWQNRGKEILMDEHWVADRRVLIVHQQVE